MLLYLDIDNFKHINDLLGHISGDTLMKYIANILKYQIKPPDIKARLGGDEFVIVLTNIMDKDDIVTKIEELLNYLRRPWVIENQEFYISISIGIALFPEHGKDLNTLLKMQTQLCMLPRKKERIHIASIINICMKKH